MNKLLLILLLLNFGCASYQTGQKVEVISGSHPKHISITGDLNSSLTTDYYSVINFNFGNGSDEWARVKSASIDFGSKEKNRAFNIVIGQDISTWAKSIEHKIAIDQHNKSVILGSLAFAGAALIASSSSSSSSQFYSGSATYLLSSGALVVDGVKRELNNLEKAKLVPDSHLYRPFSIPAGLYTKKWILLKVNKEDVPNNIFLNVDYLNGKKARYKVKLKWYYK